MVRQISLGNYSIMKLATTYIFVYLESFTLLARQEKSDKREIKSSLILTSE